MSNTWLMFTATDFGSASPQGWSLGGDREKMLWKRKRADWYPRVGSVEGMVGQGKWKTGMGEMGVYFYDASEMCKERVFC